MHSAEREIDTVVHSVGRVYPVEPRGYPGTREPHHRFVTRFEAGVIWTFSETFL